jgi:hypothetical protein
LIIKDFSKATPPTVFTPNTARYRIFNSLNRKEFAEIKRKIDILSTVILYSPNFVLHYFVM